MNAVSKISAFPPTVQPGIPQLRSLPTGWSRGPIGQHLREVRRSVSMADAELYQLVTAKRARGGIVPREKLTGREISVKSQFQIEAGDFLISKRQIVHGACGLVPRELDGAIVSNEYGVLRARSSIDSRFLSYLSHSIYFQQTCFHSAIGVHIEKMIFKLDKWLEWEFDLPPLPEQKKIAEILSTWDKAIETIEKLLANAEAQKRALMQQLLTGKRRLQGFEGSEWIHAQLSDVAAVILGSSPPSSAYNDAALGMPLLQGNADIQNGRSRPRVYTSEITQVCVPGDSLLSVRAPVGSVARSEHEACIGRGLAAVRSRTKSEQEWLHQLLLFIAPKWKTFAQGSTFEAINGADIRSLRVFVPETSSERTSVGKVLALQDALIDTMRNEVRALTREKKALMQQLLTGKRRVTV